VKRSPNTLLAIIFVFAFSTLGFSSATNVYITQNGSSQGNCTTNPQTPAWFNSSSNWGSGAAQIGPGTTVLLCGTITTPLAAQGSGSNGNAITILFDTLASITATCGGNGCLATTRQANIIVDGGTSCGWINQIQVPCNGTVRSSATQPSGSQFGIEGSNCTNCEFRNLNIGPIYVATSGGTQPSGDIRGIQALPSAGTGTWLVHNNIVHDSSSAIVYVPNGSNDNGFEDYNNVTYSINSSTDISNNNNGTLTGALVHDNNFGSTANWDGSGCPNHHNSLHLFSYTQTASGLQYYNNLINGNWGTCPTGGLFIEGNSSLVSNVTVFNNVWMLTYTPTSMGNGIVNISANSGGYIKFYNNTVIGESGSSDNCVFLSSSVSGATIDAENNIVSGCNGQIIASNTGLSLFATVDHNLYGGTSSSTPLAVNCGESGCTYYNYSSWQSACSCDSHSSFNSSTSYWGGSNITGKLLSTSPALNAGANLTSLGITGLNSDATGTARPGGTTPWAIGAYQMSGGSTTPTPPAPTGLTAIVH